MIAIRSPDADHWPDTAASEPIALKAHGLRLVPRREEKTSVEKRVEPLHAEALPTESRRIEALSTMTLPELAQPNVQTTRSLATPQVGNWSKEKLLQHWECVVESIDSDAQTFTAILRSLRNREDSEKEAAIPIEEITDDDRELLRRGAIFYWSIGYETSVSGTRKRFSRIKFRRLPAWTKRDLARVEKEAAEFAALFTE
jgi:hypothetical protein